MIRTRDRLLERLAILGIVLLLLMAQGSALFLYGRHVLNVQHAAQINACQIADGRAVQLNSALHIKLLVVDCKTLFPAP